MKHKSLINFLNNHPEMRTWQAIRAWSKAKFILTSTHFDSDMFNKKFMSKNNVEIGDTFYE